MDLRTCISNKFPGDVDAAGRERILRSIALELILAHQKACSMSLNKSPFCGLRLSLFCALGWGMARLSYFISRFPMSPALFSLLLPHLLTCQLEACAPLVEGGTSSLQPSSGDVRGWTLLSFLLRSYPSTCFPAYRIISCFSFLQNF